MSYTCLGNDVYEITLKVYRDCFNSTTLSTIPPMFMYLTRMDKLSRPFPLLSPVQIHFPITPTILACPYLPVYAWNRQFLFMM
jgi:hypothetical protein